jgi:sulfite exporter TauE/SafE
MPPSGDPLVELGLLFMVGLTMSLGHCVGMCGPLQSAIFMRYRDEGAGRMRRLPPLLLYHTGRILSYVAIGAAFALVGSMAGVIDVTPRAQGIFAIVAGLLMVPVAMALLGWIPAETWAELRWLGDRVTGRMRTMLARESTGQLFGLGVANGFLPCGPVLAVALSAAAAPSVPAGAARMLAYGLGTLPVLVVLGAVATNLSPRIRQAFHRVSGILILIIALQIVLRGLSTLGVIPPLHLGPVMIY